MVFFIKGIRHALLFTVSLKKLKDNNLSKMIRINEFYRLLDMV